MSTGYEAMAFKPRQLTFFTSADGAHWTRSGSVAIRVTAPRWAWLLMLIEPMDAADFADSPYRLPAGVTHLEKPADAVVRISGGTIVELHQAFKV